ncbi:MAG: hypothetical protein WCY53_00820 [Sphaerochaetaceae bacterium]
MKKFVYLASLLIFSVSFSYSANLQNVIPLSADLYDDIDLLYLTEGLGRASTARPWTTNEASLILSRVQKEKLSPSELILYEKSYTFLKEPLRFNYKDEFAFDVSLDGNFEIYAHSNSEDFITDRDWVYSFEKRKSLLKLNISFEVGEFFYIFTDLQYSKNRFRDKDSLFDVGGVGNPSIGAIIDETRPPGKIAIKSLFYTSPFSTNVMWPPSDLDMQTPKRAIASVGGKKWNFNLSRDRIKWGNSHIDNFIVSEHIDFHEYARLNIFTDNFKYEWLNIFFETNPYSGWNLELSKDKDFRIFMAHRLEFRILNKVTFSISENIMYSNDVFDLRFMNPAFIYHNINNSAMFNAIAHLEIDYAISKGFNTYIQAVLDQATAPNEAASQPDAFGVLGGFEWAKAFSKGVFSASVEYAYTNPALYHRNGVDFLMFRGYPTLEYRIVSHIDYIGFKYGPDTHAVQIEFTYRDPKRGVVGLKLLGLREGEVNFFTEWEDIINIRTNSPSGEKVEETAIISFWGKVGLPKKLFSLLDIAFWYELDIIGKQTYLKESSLYKNHKSDVQFTLGFSVTL